MILVDAHLDLAYNVTRGRDVRRPAREQPVVDHEIATVGLPDLREGKVALICATLFAMPASQHRPGGYRDSDQAHAQLLRQLEWYRQRVEDGSMSLVRTRADLSGIAEKTPPAKAGSPASPLQRAGPNDAANSQSFLLLMEGADPIRTPDDVPFFFNAGVRIVGLAWSRTRYAGGTGAPGPLTPQGRALVRELDRFGIIHDASHLSDESFLNLLDLTAGPIMASHSNCRAIVPGDRHLSDEMIREIMRRGGVVGVNFYDRFLLPPDECGKRRATLADVVRHIRHVCDLVGDADHVAIGTDLDGGLGRNEIPVEIVTIANLARLAESLHTAGFSGQHIQQIMGLNWFRFFRAHLPAPADGLP